MKAHQLSMTSSKQPTDTKTTYMSHTLYHIWSTI